LQLRSRRLLWKRRQLPLQFHRLRLWFLPPPWRRQLRLQFRQQSLQFRRLPWKRRQSRLR
jgi:hypothetical protein